MKFKNKLISIALSMVIGLGIFTATGCKKSVSDTDQTLEIFATNAGYGVEWLENLVESFKQQQWVKDKYPDLVIPEIGKDAVTVPAEKVIAGAKANTADLLVSCQPAGLQYSSKDSSGNFYFEELSDVFNGPIPGEDAYDGSGEGKMLKDKMDSVVYDALEVETTDGTKGRFGMPWIRGMVGFFYNKTKLVSLMGADVKLPNTTDEFVELVRQISVKMTGTNDAPIMMDGQYLNSCVVAWWAQYEGLQSYGDFWQGIDTKTGEYSAEIFKQQGRLEALKVAESLFGGQHKYVNSASLSNTFMQKQTKFFTGSAGVFTDNGDWMVNEMKGTPDAQEITLLKTPVVSSLAEKLSSVNSDSVATADKKLSFIVDCVDKNNDYSTAKSAYASAGYGELSQTDYERVFEARNMIYRMPGHEMYIPSYANGKEVAKDFLRFMASDTGIEILMKAGEGYVSPFKYNVSGELYETFNDLGKVHHDWMKTAVELPAYSSYRMWQLGGLTPWTRTSRIGTYLAAINSTDRKSAEDIYNDDVKYYTDNNNANFNLLLEKAGIR